MDVSVCGGACIVYSLLLRYVFSSIALLCILFYCVVVDSLLFLCVVDPQQCA